jgi:hypothetical protein
MNIFQWLMPGRSVRRTVMSSYKRGLLRVARNDSAAAMQDFNIVINTSDVPSDVKAMALYNRALLFTAANETAKAIDDLKAVLAVPEPLREIKSAAQKRLDRMQHRHDIVSRSGIHGRRPT